jgi:hypothetical protein
MELTYKLINYLIFSKLITFFYEYLNLRVIFFEFKKINNNIFFLNKTRN